MHQVSLLDIGKTHMYSSFRTCPPCSSLPHSLVQFPLPNASFSFNTHIESQPCKLLLFATHRTPSKISPQTQSNSVFELEEKSPIFVKKNSKLHVQELVDRIKALPTSQKDEIFKKDGIFFQTISEFNDYLMAFILANELALALQLYSNLPTYELVPDCSTYSVIIHCYCQKNEPIEAKRVLDQMINIGFQPNVADFTDLVNSFSKRGRLREATEVFKIMGKVKCEPTINAYNCLLKGLCYVGRVEEAFKLLMTIKKSSKRPDIYTYTAVMDGFCKVGRSNEALELLNEAVGMGLVPNVVTYNTLFNGYFKEGRALEGVGLLKQMKERGCLPDYISYNTLLHGLLKWGKVRAGLRVYREIVKVGYEVDERLMNSLLRGLCRMSRKEKGMLKYAYEVFDKMSSGACDIYPCARELMIEGFCIGNEMDKAFVNLCEMVRVGQSLRTFTFENVVQGLCVEGKVEAALSVLVSMCAENRIPSRATFNGLITALNRQRMVLGAACIYSAALKRGVVPKRKPRGCSPVMIALSGYEFNL